MRNETLRKALQAKKERLEKKIEPYQVELELTNRLIAELDDYEKKKAVQAEEPAGCGLPPHAEIQY